MSSDTSAPSEIGITEALECAIRAQQHGDLDQAAEIYRRILVVWPDCPDALHFSGLLAYKNGDHPQAAFLIKKSLALSPEHPGYWNNWGNVLKEQGVKIEAAAAYQRAIDLHPTFADAHNNLGVMASQQGDFVAAVKAYQNAISLQENHADAYLNLGKALEELDLLEEAILAYRARIQLIPTDPLGYGRLGIVLWRQGKKDEAIQAIVANTEIAPGDCSAFLLLGGLYIEQGHDIEAIEAFRKAIEVDPQHTGANRVLGLTLARLGKLEETNEVWRKWSEVDPANPVPRHLLQAGCDEAIPARANDQFVVHEFDRFANSFDRKLKHLQYRAPELIAAAVEKCFPEARATLDVLDAGCGTGLCAPLLRSLARHLEGVDLSPGMLDKARERGGYDSLVAAELTAFMAGKNQAYDLIVSADTLCYFGKLEDVFSAAVGALKLDGYFIFTLEKTADATTPGKVTLAPSGRYTHSEVYVETSIAEAGLSVIEISEVSLRMEYFKPVEGLLVVAQKSGSA